MSTTPALELRNLFKTYIGQVKALTDLSLNIEQGDIYALLGLNGAGKSTAMGIIAGLVKATQGQALIMGHDSAKSPQLAKPYLGMMPQEVNLNIFETPMAILCQQASYFGLPPKVAKERASIVLKQVDLLHKSQAQVRMLSGGMKRRLMIARALVHGPKVLILDEPTAGVDIEIREIIWKLVKSLNKNGTTVLLSTHYLREAEELCNKVGILHHGRLIANGPMHETLAHLDRQTLILDLSDKIKALPKMNDCTFEQISDQRIKLLKPKNLHMSDVIDQLHNQSIRLNNISNQSGDLEQLFIDLTHKKESPYAE